MKGDWLFKYPSSFCFRLANLPPNVFIYMYHDFYVLHDSDGAFVGSPSLFRGLRSWGKRIKKSCAKAALGLGKDRVVEPVHIVFNTSLMILVIPDWSNYCDSLLQHLHCKSIITAVTHRVEHVKPFYTHSGSGRIEVFKTMLTGSSFSLLLHTTCSPFSLVCTDREPGTG